MVGLLRRSEEIVGDSDTDKVQREGRTEGKGKERGGVQKTNTGRHGRGKVGGSIRGSKKTRVDRINNK